MLRHVNRRTGRRKGEYFEEVLVAVPARRRLQGPIRKVNQAG
jgi:hypothetical protein